MRKQYIISTCFKVASEQTREIKDPEPVRDSHESDRDNEMSLPALHPPADGKAEQPLLENEHRRSSGPGFGIADAEDRPMLHHSRHHSRRPTIRSISPERDAKQATRRKYLIASGFLVLSLVAFVIQTETAVYIQHELGWDKPYCML